MDFVQVIDRYGLPIAVLLVAGLFFWKLLWPLFAKQIEWNQQQVTISQERQREMQIEFTVALRSRDEVQMKHTAVLQEVLEQLRRSNR